VTLATGLGVGFHVAGKQAAIALPGPVLVGIWSTAAVVIWAAHGRAVEHPAALVEGGAQRAVEEEPSGGARATRGREQERNVGEEEPSGGARATQARKSLPGLR